MATNLNETPKANRVHIGFFGATNSGKSSLINAITKQDISIVSQLKGTTTDPVEKAMELLPLGPVVLIDTPGIDDDSIIGEKRVEKTRRILTKVDIGVIVVDSEVGIGEYDEELIQIFKAKELPYIIAYNKSDLLKKENLAENEIAVSNTDIKAVEELKERIAKIALSEKENQIIADKLTKNDIVILVTPIDSAAPKGRMILPQVQTIRDVLEAKASCICTEPEQLAGVFNALKEKPTMVITDSQAFHLIKDIVPEDVPLTSFSILFARYKNIFNTTLKGAYAIEDLKDGDKILVCEGCSHHRQKDDIGTVKLPKMLLNYTKKDLIFEHTAGGHFPKDLSEYALIIHCGACMINDKEMLYREKLAIEAGIGLTNYGLVLAYLNGILKRSISLFPELENK